MGAGRRTETINVNGHSLAAGGSNIPKAPQRKLAERKRLGSVIFGCTNLTHNECVTNKLFGLPFNHHTYVDFIEPGMPIFLFNYTERKMHGIFEAVSVGALNISPYAWTTGTDLSRTPYPAQVRVQLRTDFSRIVSLPESVFKETLLESYYSPSHFFFEVDVEQTERLIKLFERTAGNLHRPALPKSPAGAWQTPVASKMWKKTNGSGEMDDKLKLKKPATVVMNEWGTGSQYFPSSSNEAVAEEEIGAQQQSLWSRRSRDADEDLSDESEDLQTSYKGPEVTSEAEMRRTLGDKTELDHSQVKSVSGYRPKLGGTSDVQPSTAEVAHNDAMDLKKRSSTSPEEVRRVLERLELITSAPKETLLPQVQKEGELLVKHNNSGTVEWETWARDNSIHEQTLLREEREKLGSTLSELDSSVAMTVKTNLELYAQAIGQMRQDGMELRRLLDEAKVREEEFNAMKISNASMAADMQILKLEVVDLRRLLGKSGPQEKYDHAHENGGSQLMTVELPNHQTPPDIYLIGGLGDRLSRLESVMVWSPATDQLRTAAPMLTPRCCAGASVLDGNIYVFGGGDGTSWYDNVEKYDQREDQWVTCAPMKTKRGSLGGVTLGDRIFAVGGGNGIVSFSEVESYDPYLGLWLPCSSMLDKRFCLAATELGGALYALGGFDGEQYLMSMERFDPREALWTRMPPMSVKRGSLSAAVLNGKIYALGGYDGDEILDVVETFDPRAGRWDKGRQMCCHRAYGAVAVVGDALYYMGGLAEDETVDSDQRSREIVNGTHEDEAGHDGQDGGYRSWRSHWQASWQQFILGSSVPDTTFHGSKRLAIDASASYWEEKLLGSRCLLTSATLDKKPVKRYNQNFDK